MKKRMVLLSVLCAFMLSACTDDISSSDYSSHSSVSSAVSTESTSTSEEPVSTSESSSGGTTSSSEQLSSVTESSAPEPPPVSSETTSATVSTSTESISESSVPAAVKPAEITVKPISSPGTKVEKSETAVIDYSNADKGYISAAYSGGSARAKLRIVSGKTTCDHDLAVTGVAEYFPLMQGSGSYKIQIYEQLEGKKYTLALELVTDISIADEVAMYLYPNRYSMFTRNSECVKKSAEVCAGADGVIEKTAAIFSYITENVTYDHQLAATVKSGYIPDPDSVFRKKTGICFDYASLFCAMARSQNIPTRLVIGYAKPDIYHAWNEVYTKETGWITPELLLDKNGFNILDATFYAGAEDKSDIADYISNDGNYTSVFRY